MGSQLVVAGQGSSPSQWSQLFWVGRKENTEAKTYGREDCATQVQPTGNIYIRKLDAVLYSV
jgi:hypothetical protein